MTYVTPPNLAGCSTIDLMTTPKLLPALLTSREYARVARVDFQRNGRDETMTKAQYRARLNEVAMDLYPAKVNGATLRVL